MRYELVIFDCDGTLVDTATDVAQCFNEALIKCGFDGCPYEVVSSLIGKPLEAIVGGLLDYGGKPYDQDDVGRVATAYRSVYAGHPKPNTRPFPGMPEIVDDLLSSGIAVAVNSNKPEPALVKLVNQCFPGRNIAVVGYVSERPTKPDPSGALQLMRDAGVSVERSVYVGDTIVDYETAYNAGMQCVMMTWGQGNDEAYNTAGLSACCDNADQLRIALGL